MADTQTTAAAGMDAEKREDGASGRSRTVVAKRRQRRIGVTVMLRQSMGDAFSSFKYLMFSWEKRVESDDLWKSNSPEFK